MQLRYTREWKVEGDSQSFNLRWLSEVRLTSQSLALGVDPVVAYRALHHLALIVIVLIALEAHCAVVALKIKKKASKNANQRSGICKHIACLVPKK